MSDSDGNNKASTIDTVQVALRIRPLMKNEIERGCDECIEIFPEEAQVQIKELAFRYNYVFPQHISQLEFYDTAIKGLIVKLFQGYNVTILAYGQTGSGKTYTMGTNYSGSDGDSTKLGVIPQAVADIFDFIEANEDKFVFRVSVSFMELYQEQCYDLLSGKERAHSIIEIREDINKGVILPGITEISVSSTMETMMALERGSIGRVTGSTAMNQASSRSHAVFTIVIAKESRTDKNLATTSKFHLVDLAGSERIKKTKASGERLKEGVKINQGLLALGNVISALGDGTNRSFISYRDSKLTRLLQDSLGGNSLTLMVACVSPADYNLDETVSTLRYADRARRIRNKPIINQDAKAAEIIRLNNLVNQLRLQLLGKMPTSNESNDKLLEELEQTKAKNVELLKKHKHLTEHLGNMLIENTNLCEKALLAEAAKDKIERKLNELREQCNQTIENLSSTEVLDDENKKLNVVDYIKEIKMRLEDLQSLNTKTDEELLDHEIKISFHSKDENDNDRLDDEVILNEDQVVIEEEKRAMGQVALNQELQELNRAMAIKATVVQAILASNKDMTESQDALREYQNTIQALEKEKDELTQLLKQTKSKDPTHEERRAKISSLEAEIANLKKKCQEQAHIIKTKEKNEAKIAALNAELQAMKVTKVKIIKQMREESEKFRKWRADNERAMLRLRTEDRKRATAMAKMETLHAKQQNVLKRKMEEAVAVNKRLKEALERQKVSQMKRNAKGNVKSGAIQQYVEQELEVHLSIVEAEKSLEELMEYRAWITEQIEKLRNGPDTEESRRKIAELEDDLALRKAQISDLQQKILTADQENKARTQWDNIQSMLEAKVALKCLFELLVESKRELQSQSEKGYQARCEEIQEAHDRLVMEYENCKAEYERQLALAKQQSEQKISTLVALQRGVISGNTDKSEACRRLEQVIQMQEERLEAVESENKKLTEELENLRAGGKKTKKSGEKKGDKKDEKNTEFMDITDEDVHTDDDEKDPDWRATPLFKRIQAQRSRLTMNFEPDSSSRIDSKSVKRSSDGATHCACRGSCHSRLCGCVKAEKGCGTSCRCQPVLCKNRRLDDDSEDKENNWQKRKDFLHRIVTGDEKWIHYNNPKRRKSWGKPRHASALSAKPNIHGLKLLLCICTEDPSLSVSYQDSDVLPEHTLATIDEVNEQQNEQILLSTEHSNKPDEERLNRMRLNKFLREKNSRKTRSNYKTQRWMLALLLYNTCLAPMSTYCANNIVQYGIDVAKYNLVQHVFKFLVKEHYAGYFLSHTSVSAQHLYEPTVSLSAKRQYSVLAAGEVDSLVGRRGHRDRGLGLAKLQATYNYERTERTLGKGTALYYTRSLCCCPIDVPPLINMEATGCRLTMTDHGTLSQSPSTSRSPKSCPGVTYGMPSSSSTISIAKITRRGC
ncbi:Chromosome-associated kinesin KIF4 [Eumeta japonica]|uniref:Chromosome-associated kinesin KIF4 n=1 Tax=Eumeta variegata TaxID=151549 RepID=A0A4C1TIP2_EUMVA|nr:Chromosome-associated kinesin KIF4 [Eumeta japonica]